MIRASVLWLALAGSVAAQGYDWPDVIALRETEADTLATDFPEALKLAAVLAEDPNYFNRFHANSTLTSVVGKIFTPGVANVWQRKALEIRVAIDLANEFSHDEVLSLWLGNIFLGKRCYGAADAAEGLLGIPLQALTLRDALTLMTLPREPSTLTSDPEERAERFGYLVAEAVSEGLIAAEDAAELLAVGPTPFVDEPGCPVE